MNATLARRVRLQRLHQHVPGRLLLVPLDHSVGTGPIVRDGSLDRLVGELADNGADAVVLHKGALRHVQAGRFRRLSLIVHLSASTVLAPDPDAKYLVSTVEEALRTGADAVSVHVNVGSRTESRQIADLAAVSEACDRWSVPLLAMVYPRGPGVADGHDPALVAHAATIAADLGADLVKTVYPGSRAAMALVAARCPIPVLTAGGPADGGTDDALRRLGDALCAGAAGVAVGRLIIHAADPGAMTRRIAGLVHDRNRSGQELPT